ncbi:unnamed protein product, partial [Rotaria sp. Silwood2]
FCGFGDNCKFLHDRCDYKYEGQHKQKWNEHCYEAINNKKEKNSANRDPSVYTRRVQEFQLASRGATNPNLWDSV